MVAPSYLRGFRWFVALVGTRQLERHRLEKGELKDAERQRENHAREREAFHHLLECSTGAEATAPDLDARKKARYISSPTAPSALQQEPRRVLPKAGP